MPIKKPLSDKDTLEAEVARSFAMAGNPGKYMSIENGVKAVRLPKIRTNEKKRDFVIQKKFWNYYCRDGKSVCKRPN